MSISVEYITEIEQQVEMLVSRYHQEEQAFEKEVETKIEQAQARSMQVVQTFKQEETVRSKEVIHECSLRLKQEENDEIDAINSCIECKENQLIATILEEVHRRYGSH
ncbi:MULTISPECIES: hypothetical protein [unclassified Granulicatella]|uniref:hypothetical protein n=1 Tax=unclassified Granulicatella TaxID=2630493 RepID=UPI001074917A|nr:MULTISPECIES: hypothetical protein [unclassified Granulicatella]MBF0780214.1 hypothetical protein [Granulicatella sp. 19428wC4_WM01]TFU95707.1 hypothetical protein E4T68_03800 [Granulicatella sp. WM01]